ncbi:MAG: HupE/UreJ family protein [Acidobacteria bacterium]|nr:MAG: HupE/UreJ family protein [Acidobacteriota bacterium]REJ99517.1 MAG: HupE/UreJ family protein [Acidobacteriota bacterium]
MLWKQPLLEGRILRLEPLLEPPCVEVASEAPEITSGVGSAVVHRTTLDCSGAGADAAAGDASGDASGDTPEGTPGPGLAARTLRIDGLERTITDVMVHVERLDGESQRHLLKPAAPSTPLGGASGAAVPAYLVLGVEHLLFGFDHILFVIGLLFFVRSPWRLVQTITAFTVAHSITLALSTLELVRLSSGPVEATIALSILFLAVELLHPEERRSALTRDRPWLFAFCFGLLHGFGFAGALAEIGLPKGAIALSLFLFNLGVEIGQLLVVAVILLALALLGERLTRLPLFVRRLPIHAIGLIAAYWTVERTVALL